MCLLLKQVKVLYITACLGSEEKEVPLGQGQLRLTALFVKVEPDCFGGSWRRRLREYRFAEGEKVSPLRTGAQY